MPMWHLVTVTMPLLLLPTIQFSTWHFIFSASRIFFCVLTEKSWVPRVKRKEKKKNGKKKWVSKRERESIHGLQAVNLQFVVLDQAMCKHEGAVLWSWQTRYRRKGKNKNIERETNGKWSGAVGWWGADSGHGEILPLASNSCLCATQRQEEIEATKALWKPSSMCQGNK